MKIIHIEAQNFKTFENLNLNLDGKSAVIFGVNGTGKSTVLSVINYVFRPWVYRLNQAQGISYRSFEEEQVHIGKSNLSISTLIEMNGVMFDLNRSYTKSKAGKAATSSNNKKVYDDFVNLFSDQYLEMGISMPIFVNYGTNRSVLEIPLRIRQKHEFTQLTALERTIENELDFRTFFEWYRNQEDIENEYIRETGNRGYQDRYLKCVRFAIEKMLGDVSDLKVKRSPLRMTVRKRDIEIRVDQLSDGEKCTLALFGDLARRIALANPQLSNPLEGEGIVLIDEIELHMHPSWQRRVLHILKEVFPNIQFIVTTHSPQVLGEVDDSYMIYRLDNQLTNEGAVTQVSRMDVFDSNYILEEFMNTSSCNQDFKTMINQTYEMISNGQFDKAKQMIDQIKNISSENSSNIVKLEGYWKRCKILHEKNN